MAPVNAKERNRKKLRLSCHAHGEQKEAMAIYDIDEFDLRTS